MRYSFRLLFPFAALVFALTAVASAGGPSLDRSLTYQGRLDDGGAPANGVYDMAFSIWNDPQAGAASYAVGVQDVQVVNGLFTVKLDSVDLTSTNRWLQISVEGQMLQPRQQLTASPYALQVRGMQVSDAGNVGIDEANPLARLHVNGGADAGPATGGFVIIGSTAGQNIALDNNEIMARSAGSPATLALNADGGNVLVNSFGSGRLGVGTSQTKGRIHVNGDYYGLGHLWLHAFEGDGNDGTAYVQARDDSGSSHIGLTLRTQAGGAFRDAVIISPAGSADILGNVTIGGAQETLGPPRLYINAGDTFLGPQTPLTLNRIGDGTLISFRRNDVLAGSITVSGAAVSYNAFTGSHYAWTDARIERGTLVRLTGDNRRLHENVADSEIIYGIEAAATANDPACIGAYLGMEDPSADSAIRNPHLIAAAGNGELWIVDDGGGDIAPGDALISSHIAGCAMKDDPSRFEIGHIIAFAAEPVRWSEVEVDARGVRRARVSIFFDRSVRGAAAGDPALRASVERLERENRALHDRLDRLEALLKNPAPGDAHR